MKTLLYGIVVEMERKVGMTNKLRKRREQLNLTQKEVAERLHIAESAYQRYEHGKSTPSAKRAITIATVLKTTVERLFS